MTELNMKGLNKRIVIIGGGNVADQLIRNITSSGHKLVQIYNRTLSRISSYSEEANIIGHVNQITPNADIYIVCVKDSAIEEIATRLNLGNKLILHTSGNRSIDLLRPCSTNYGVFYPIQSFTKNIPVDFKNVPLVIEANGEAAFNQLEAFSKTISNTVIQMSETDRQKLNMACVFVNNFTNHLFTMMYDYLKKENIEFSLLLPLIRNTMDKLSLGAPAEMQTGPAIRNDLETIQSHLRYLEQYPELKEIYERVTDRIQKYHLR